MAKWGILLKKQEMTRVWSDGKYIPVTLFVVPAQELVRWKTQEKDGYIAAVVGADKKDLDKEKGIKTKWWCMAEFGADAADESWTPSVDLLEEGLAVTVVSTSRGKGFQWVMKRHNFGWGPATHGSKFHRAGWSTGNRKPRRTIKGFKMAGRMGGDQITLKNIAVVSVWKNADETVVALKGSIPGGYNAYTKIHIV